MENDNIIFEGITEADYKSDEQLLANPNIYTNQDLSIIMRDNLLKENLDISFTDYLGNKVINYYSLLYLPKVIEFKQKGVKNIIYLDERQILDVNRLYHIIKTTGRAVDISPPGSGKSIIAMVLSIMLDMKGIVVIAEKSIQTTWNKMEEEEFAGIDITFIKTTDVIGSRKNIPNGDFFLNGDEAEKKDTLEFYGVGKKYKKYLKDGYLIIFDEFHSAKNDNNNSRGFHRLTKHFCDTLDTPANNSALLFMSASPSDKGELNPVFYVLNLVDAEKLVTGGIGGLQLKNRSHLERFIRLCKSLDKKAEKNCFKMSFNKPNVMNKKTELSQIPDGSLKDVNVNDYLRNAMEMIFISRFFSYTSNRNSQLVKNNINRLYKPDVNYHLVKLNYEDGFDPFLKLFARYIQLSYNSKGKGSILTLYNYIIRTLSFLLIPIIIDMAVEVLSEDIEAKVIVYTNVVNQNIKHKKGETSKFNVLEYIAEEIEKRLKKKEGDMLERKEQRAKELRKKIRNGNIKKHYDSKVNKEKIIQITSSMDTPERSELVKLFEEDNSKCRCIVTSIGVLSTGVSLDDTHGKRERYIIASLGFRGDYTVQLMGRLWRRNTLSRGHILFPVAIGNNIELNVNTAGKRQIKFKNLSEYKAAAGIKHINILDIGSVPYGHLNYAIGEVLNKKSKNMQTFNADCLTDELDAIPYVFHTDAEYPSDGKVGSDFKSFIRNVKIEIDAKLKEKNFKKSKSGSRSGSRNKVRIETSSDEKPNKRKKSKKSRVETSSD